MTKNIILIVVGIIALLVSAIIPFPMMLELSGIVWRVLFALLGIALIFLGVKNFICIYIRNVPAVHSYLRIQFVSFYQI